MSEAALLVASISLVVSGLALGWQIAVWLMSGSRPRINLTHAVTGPALASTPIRRGGSLKDYQHMRDQGWDGPELLGIEVTNHGRIRLQITRFAVVHPTSGTVLGILAPNEFSAPLPHFIDPGTTAAWYGDLDTARQVVTAMNAAESTSGRDVKMRVTLGTGKELTTKRSVKI